jgi:uncharacterized protein (DUF1697 family)
MARYVALFGSINVGGNRLKMVDLRAAFEAEGFSDVETVVASGNVIFSTPRAADARAGREADFDGRRPVRHELRRFGAQPRRAGGCDRRQSVRGNE